ncbi:MAG: hypothetical protein L3J04_00390 [Robiginitomaculum sp.]|nr:hypothetical protein [Robiginitomaculum sp.]
MMKIISLLSPLLLFIISLISVFAYMPLAIYLVSPAYGILTTAGVIIYLTVQVCWPFAVNSFLKNKYLPENPKKKISFGYLIGIAFAGIILSLIFGARELFVSNLFWMNIVDSISVISVILLLYVYVRICWSNAYILQTLERNTKARSSEVFGSFLLFLYWIIGVFFLHKRLVKLSEAESEKSI